VIFFRYQKAGIEAQDTRVKRTNEILTGIKYIKMSGNEEKFLENVILYATGLN